MNIEDISIGMRVITRTGILATVKGFWPNAEYVKLVTIKGTKTTGKCAFLKPAPFQTTEDAVYDAFALKA